MATDEGFSLPRWGSQQQDGHEPSASSSEAGSVQLGVVQASEQHLLPTHVATQQIGPGQVVGSAAGTRTPTPLSMSRAVEVEDTTGWSGQPSSGVASSSEPRDGVIAGGQAVGSVQVVSTEAPVATPHATRTAQEPSPESSSEPPFVVQDLGRALDAVLAHYGWQHLAVQRLRSDLWTISGAAVQVKVESAAELSSDNGAGGQPPCQLSASDDGGRTWQPLDALVRRRRLHKVVRTAPIVTGTREYQPDHSLISPIVASSPESVSQGMAASGTNLGSHAAARQGPQSPAAPLSLAELAASAQQPGSQVRGQVARTPGGSTGGSPWTPAGMRGASPPVGNVDPYISPFRVR